MSAKILVVDDETDLQGLLSQMFRRQIRGGDYSFRFASDGEEGLITADVIHHPIQARHPGWNSRACEHQPTAIATRRQIFEDIAAANTLVLPAHFEPCRLAREGDDFRFLFD